MTKKGKEISLTKYNKYMCYVQNLDDMIVEVFPAQRELGENINTGKDLPNPIRMANTDTQ